MFCVPLVCVHAHMGSHGWVDFHAYHFLYRIFIFSPFIISLTAHRCTAAVLPFAVGFTYFALHLHSFAVLLVLNAHVPCIFHAHHCAITLYRCRAARSFCSIARRDVLQCCATNACHDHLFPIAFWCCCLPLPHATFCRASLSPRARTTAPYSSFLVAHSFHAVACTPCVYLCARLAAHCASPAPVARLCTSPLPGYCWFCARTRLRFRLHCAPRCRFAHILRIYRSFGLLRFAFFFLRTSLRAHLCTRLMGFPFRASCTLRYGIIA